LEGTSSTLKWFGLIPFFLSLVLYILSFSWETALEIF
jgi:hypothetical protein